MNKAVTEKPIQNPFGQAPKLEQAHRTMFDKNQLIDVAATIYSGYLAGALANGNTEVLNETSKHRAWCAGQAEKLIQEIKSKTEGV